MSQLSSTELEELKGKAQAALNYATSKHQRYLNSPGRQFVDTALLAAQAMAQSISALAAIDARMDAQNTYHLSGKSPRKPGQPK